MVSVVITTYGRKPEIVERALASVENQTFTDWELIVVDDNEGMNELSSSIKIKIEEKNSKKIRYIQMDKNSGACAARNQGIANSAGDFIAFLDDDDEWFPTKLERQIPLFADDRVGFVYAGMLLFYEKEKKKVTSRVKFKNGNVYNELLKYNFIGSTSSVIVRREAILACGGFAEDMPSSQDYETWIRLSKKYDVASVPENLVLMHFHEGDSITKSLERRIEGYRKLLEKHIEDISQNRKAYSYQLYNLGKFLILNNEYEEGIQLLWQAIKMCPSYSIYYFAVIVYWKLVRR